MKCLTFCSDLDVSTLDKTMSWKKRDAINQYVEAVHLINKESRGFFPKYSPGKACAIHNENLKNLSFMLGINLDDDAIDPAGRTDRDYSVFNHAPTQDIRKRIFKIVGWVYVVYAAIMLCMHVPTLFRELMGGYSYMKFSNIEPKFDLEEKSWFFGDRLTFEYRFFQTPEGSHRWHSRLKFVNDKPYQQKYPTDSPWRESAIDNGGVHILLRWPSED
jgi:hypothetical protein